MVARPAWYCTVAGGQEGSVVTAAALAAGEGVRSSGDEDEEGIGEKSEKGAEEKAVRLSRRQKGTGGDVEGNADLLIIPGVGPKNLRKLVEKGFTGMAELKQFYKDKVMVIVFVNFEFWCSGFVSSFFSPDLWFVCCV